MAKSLMMDGPGVDDGQDVDDGTSIDEGPGVDDGPSAQDRFPGVDDGWELLAGSFGVEWKHLPTQLMGFRRTERNARAHRLIGS